MNKSFRLITLKILSITAIFSFLYPVILLLRIFIFRHQAALWEAIYNYIIVLSGLFTGFVIIGGSKSKKRKMAAIAAVLFPLIISSAVYIRSGVWHYVFEAVVCLIFYYYGLRAYYNSFDNILNRKKTIFGAVLLLVSLVLSLSFDFLSSAKIIIFFLAHIFLGSVLFVSNQSGIDEAFYKRHIDKANIPGKMRRYNTFLVLWMYIIIALLINIKNLVGVISYVLKVIIINGLKAIFWIMMLISRLFTSDSKEEGQQQGQGALPGLGGETEKGILPVILNIIMIGILLFILYILIKNMPRILKFIKSKIKALYVKIAEIVKRLIKVSNGNYGEEDDYHDEIQTLKVRDNNGGSKKGINSMFWRKSLKSITDPSEKIRFIYYTILNKIKLFNIMINKSDTTGEILAKSIKLPDIVPYFNKITGTYEETRYGETMPDSRKVKEAEENLAQINSILHRIKK